jgi:hypothetical protein
MRELRNSIKSGIHCQIKDGNRFRVICMENHVKTTNEIKETPFDFEQLEIITERLTRVVNDFNINETNHCTKLLELTLIFQIYQTC